MFSSLASFIFGSYSPATNSETTIINNSDTKSDSLYTTYDSNDNNLSNIIDDRNTIEVTSRTPSVTGSNPKLTTTSSTTSTTFAVNSRSGKNKNKNNKNHFNHYHRGNKKSTLPLKQQQKNFISDIDDEDWVLLEKENNEEELSLVSETNQKKKLSNNEKNQRNNHQSHSICSGQQHQQQHNYHHRPLKILQNPSILSVSTYNTTTNTNNIGAICDGGPTQSLYIVSSGTNVADDNHLNIQKIPSIKPMAMEESWFLTPPPCFTSTGPINMEISPFENLLIEHPSMSVYHSIRSAQETTESFINIDIGVEESQQVVFASSEQNQNNNQIAQQTPSKTPQHRSCDGHRTDRFTTSQIKQEILARNTQKSIENQKRQSLCRSAIMRSNKVREICSNGNRPRRSDLQHFRILSRANNNRKC